MPRRGRAWVKPGLPFRSLILQNASGETPGGTFINEGTIEAGEEVEFRIDANGGGASVTNDGGALDATAAGALIDVQTGGNVLTIDGGMVEGDVLFRNVALSLGAAPAGGVLWVEGSSNILVGGTVPAGLTLAVTASDRTGSAILRIDDDSTNSGTILLTSTSATNNRSATVSVSRDVTLTNAAGGRIVAEAGTGLGQTGLPFRSLILQNASGETPGGTFINEGTIEAGEEVEFRIDANGGGASVTNDGGTLDATAAGALIDVQTGGNVLTIDGGMVEGDVLFRNVALSLGAAPAGGVLSVEGSSNILVGGTVPAGLTLAVTASDRTGSAILRIDDDSTNSGTILLTSTSATNNRSATVSVSRDVTLTNAAGGRDSSPKAGTGLGQRQACRSGSLILQNASGETPGGTFINEGTIEAGEEVEFRIDADGGGASVTNDGGTLDATAAWGPRQTRKRAATS